MKNKITTTLISKFKGRKTERQKSEASHHSRFKSKYWYQCFVHKCLYHCLVHIHYSTRVNPVRFPHQALLYKIDSYYYAYIHS